MDRHGRVDAFILNAGIVGYHGIVDTPEHEWNSMLAINVAAPWWLCRAVWPHMAATGYGRVVMTVSGFALRAVPGADVTATLLASRACPGSGQVLVAAGGTWALDAMSRTREVDLGPDASPEAVLGLVEQQMTELKPFTDD